MEYPNTVLSILENERMFGAEEEHEKGARITRTLSMQGKRSVARI